MNQSDLITKKIEFLARPVDALKSLARFDASPRAGENLYYELGKSGVSYAEYFKAIGTDVETFVRDTFKVDLHDCTIEKYFSSDPNAKWLFPDIVRDGVLSGLRHRPIHPRLVASNETSDGNSYQVPYVDEAANEDEEMVRDVAEGTEIPTSEIKYGDRIIIIGKKGRGIVASYEAMKRMKIDMLRVHLERIGQRIGIQLDDRAADILRLGNAAESAPTAIPVITPGTLDYEDLVTGYLELWAVRKFTPTHILASAVTGRKILVMPEFKDGLLFDFSKTGKIPNPLGLSLEFISSQPDDTVTIMDNRFAMVKVTENDVSVESDKLISKQWDRSYITVNIDFAVLYKEARVILAI